MWLWNVQQLDISSRHPRIVTHIAALASRHKLMVGIRQYFLVGTIRLNLVLSNTTITTLTDKDIYFFRNPNKKIYKWLYWILFQNNHKKWKPCQCTFIVLTHCLNAGFRCWLNRTLSRVSVRSSAPRTDAF